LKVKSLEEKLSNLEAYVFDIDKVKSLGNKLANLEEMVKALTLSRK
jgi:hypothetical protein